MPANASSSDQLVPAEQRKSAEELIQSAGRVFTDGEETRSYVRDYTQSDYSDGRLWVNQEQERIVHFAKTAQAMRHGSIPSPEEIRQDARSLSLLEKHAQITWRRNHYFHYRMSRDDCSNALPVVCDILAWHENRYKSGLGAKGIDGSLWTYPGQKRGKDTIKVCDQETMQQWADPYGVWPKWLKNTATSASQIGSGSQRTGHYDTKSREIKDYQRCQVDASKVISPSSSNSSLDHTASFSTLQLSHGLGGTPEAPLRSPWIISSSVRIHPDTLGLLLRDQSLNVWERAAAAKGLNPYSRTGNLAYVHNKEKESWDSKMSGFKILSFNISHLYGPDCFYLNKDSLLHKFPPEIRMQIYREVFKIEERRKWNATSLMQGHIDTSLMKCCRAVYLESRCVPLMDNELEFNNITRANRFLKYHISPMQLKLLKHLLIRPETPCFYGHNQDKWEGVFQSINKIHVNGGSLRTLTIKIEMQWDEYIEEEVELTLGLFHNALCHVGDFFLIIEDPQLPYQHKEALHVQWAAFLTGHASGLPEPRTETNLSEFIPFFSHYEDLINSMTVFPPSVYGSIQSDREDESQHVPPTNRALVQQSGFAAIPPQTREGFVSGEVVVDKEIMFQIIGLPLWLTEETIRDWNYPNQHPEDIIEIDFGEVAETDRGSVRACHVRFQSLQAANNMISYLKELGKTDHYAKHFQFDVVPISDCEGSRQCVHGHEQPDHKQGGKQPRDSNDVFQTPPVSPSNDLVKHLTVVDANYSVLDMLPKHIRKKIYGYVLQIQGNEPAWCPRWFVGHVDAALLTTCRKIQEEAYPFLLSANEFSFTCPTHALRFLQGLPFPYKSLEKHLRITVTAEQFRWDYNRASWRSLLSYMQDVGKCALTHHLTVVVKGPVGASFRSDVRKSWSGFKGTMMRQGSFKLVIADIHLRSLKERKELSHLWQWNLTEANEDTYLRALAMPT